MPRRRSSATSRWRSVCRCTAQTRGCCRWVPRRAAAGCSPRPACPIRRGSRTCTTWRTSSMPWCACAPRGRARRMQSSSSTTASRSAATRRWGSAGCWAPGNAPVELRGLPAPGSSEEAAALRERAQAMAFEHRDMRLEHYLGRLREDGGIVEERVSGLEVRSPSVQLRVTPLGEVELLSTHDQLLGGPSGQSYLGCRFPGDFGYARAITAEAAKIGAQLAAEGVLGRFAVDFVVVRDAHGDWDPYAIELNLRKGGTTHPFLTLQFLTDGSYDPVTGLFTAPSGREKHLVATDHLESYLLRGLTIDDLFDIIVRQRLHFDPARQTGVVFHMISALSENGRIGLTAAGDTPEQADATYRRAERTLVEEAEPPREPSLPAL